MNKKNVLICAPNYGYWGEELQAPWDILKAEGHNLTLATPRGKKPLPFAISVDPEFVDPIQNYKTNPPEVCKRTKELVDGKEWANPIKIKDAKIKDYDAIILTCGPGALLDMNPLHDLHLLLLEAFYANKLIGALCYSVAALVFTRNPKNHYRSIIYGKNITAHPRAWDFHFDVNMNDLYGATPDNKGAEVIVPGFLYPLQDLVTDAVGPDGQCVYAEDATRENPRVIYDHPFITGASVESSICYGEKIAAVLAGR